jgi:VWFA-related protein
MSRALVRLLVLLMSSVTLAGQQPTFKTAVDLVSVDVLVTDGGRPVTGLKAADFEVLDNNVRQKVDSISGDGSTSGSVLRIPLDVVLVLDTSDSVAGEKLQLLKDAARGVVARVRPGDRVALVTFSHRTVVRQQLSGDTASVGRALDSLSARGRTSMFDALYTALTLRRTSDTRAVVLLFSDAADNSSWLGGRQLSKVARQSDAVVYAVGLDKRVKEDLADIAAETGGDVLLARSAKDLRNLFERVVREMQSRYVLKYYPNNVATDGWHTLQVRVPARRLEVVARRGYWRQ